MKPVITGHMFVRRSPWTASKGQPCGKMSHVRNPVHKKGHLKIDLGTMLLKVTKMDHQELLTKIALCGLLGRGGVRDNLREKPRKPVNLEVLSWL